MRRPDRLRRPPPWIVAAALLAALAAVAVATEPPSPAGRWADRPPVRPAIPGIPATVPAGSVRNPIDPFVLAGLAQHGLTPAPEADRRTLIRRLSFDLTGLPPTPEEVDSFLADPRPDAYERLVDRLLASPRHGERLAAWWLDLVRYADTTGYHGDNPREVSPYRDWVVDAFNRNLPFDAFTLAQLAGDLLPGATEAQRIATGYNRLILTTAEPGAQARDYVARHAADRVRNASTVWLAATLACAECHDHKYDPLTARDFYRFAAFFADIQEPAVGLPEPTRFPTPAQTEALQRLDRVIADHRMTLDTAASELTLTQNAWEATASKGPTGWRVARPERAVSEAGATLAVRDDGSILASGDRPPRDVHRLTFRVDQLHLTGLRIDLIPDGSLPGLGPGRGADGRFVLNELELMIEGAEPRRVAWANASATHAQGGFAAAAAVDGNLATGWAIAPEFGRPHHAVFEAKEEFGPRSGADGPVTLTLVLRFEHGEGQALGRFRVSLTDGARPLAAGTLPSRVQALLETPAASRTEAEAAELAAYYRSIAPALQPVRDALAAARAERQAIEAAAPRSLVTRAGPPRVVRVLPRGDWMDESGPVVRPAVPASLSGGSTAANPIEGEGDDPDPETGSRATRLDLARWIVSRDNPRTARVLANRVWALLFGRGLAANLDDLGARGAGPTHPELLDHLAVELIESGWDVRALIRTIVTSGTYRRSSHIDASSRARDPSNLWLARQGRWRVDAEMVRDAALAASGLLVERRGGPPARPYQPPGYWSHLSFPKREYAPDHGAGLYRRGVYTFWCRTFLHPSLLVFDAPTRAECAVERHSTSTPLQALALLNDPTHVEAARVLAARTLRDGGPDAGSRLRWLFRRVLSRVPGADEAKALTALLGEHRSHYAADRVAAAELLSVGEFPADPHLDPAELAAWTSVARVVFNLREAITRD